MTKYFCDKCGDEITSKNECCGGDAVESRLGTTIKFRPKGRLIIDPEDRFTVEILTASTALQMLVSSANTACSTLSINWTTARNLG